MALYNYLVGRLKMKLYLIQHAKAASKEDDPQRSLTEEGRRDIQKIAEFIKPLNLSVDYLWHSGKTRAQQTAEALVEVINVKEEMSAREGLAPNDDVKVIKDEIVSANQDIMLVGHMPFVSRLASLLLTSSESSGPISFRQGGIVCLNYSDGNQWQLNWMITPDLLI
jgi:phosphohistidine phosphatase